MVYISINIKSKVTLPVNIKITTNTCDNVGNITIYVQAYTNHVLDYEKTYKSGDMSNILVDKLKKKEYNYCCKKDYYFIVLNKCKNNEIIINSIKSLVKLYPNTNNLQYQIKWYDNKEFVYENISKKINMFVDCILLPKPCWKFIFMNGMM